MLILCYYQKTKLYFSPKIEVLIKFTNQEVRNNSGGMAKW
jgi:hypothetical protein